MSTQDIRNYLIQKNTEKLIKSLTGFQEDDENFEICEQFVLSKFRHHKNLSVNSHEIKRRMDGLFEHLEISNYTQCAEHFRKLYNIFINHPLCEQHYETDIQWSILNFLLDISHSPVGTIRENFKKIDLNIDIEQFITVPKVNQDLIDVLVEDNIYIHDNSSFIGDVSDLSDWTDSENDEAKQTDQNEENSDSLSDHKIDMDKNKTSLNILPPQNPKAFVKFNGTDSGAWLIENVQHSWWNNDCEHFQSFSTHTNAQFCHVWNNFISKLNNVPPQKCTTTSEYCLLREIIWMFTSAPRKCTFFYISKNVVLVRENVSINSVTLNTMKLFLNHYATHMTIMLKLQNFCKAVIESRSDKAPPHSYESYANGVQELLDPFRQFLQQKEDEIKEQRPTFGKTITVANLYNAMEPHFEVLNSLYQIYRSAVLDFDKYPPHICSSHLLAQLLSEVNNTGNRQHANTAAALFVATVKVYLRIIDTWWTNGRLDDFQNEFLIKRKESQNAGAHDLNGFEKRLLAKNKENGFYLNSSISSNIESSDFIKLLYGYSMQAGFALNILSSLDRIHEMKMKCGHQENLYEIFLQMILNKLSKFTTSSNTEKQPQLGERTNEVTSIDKEIQQQNIEEIKNFRNEFLYEGNEILFMAFEESLNLVEANANDNDQSMEPFNETVSATDFYKKLNRFSALILPFSDIILETLTELLESRISVANSYVMKMYSEEYQIEFHLHNLRKVFLLEASDSMFIFYTNLFKQIESNDSWNNPYILTVQLNGILSTKYPEMSSLFSVHVEPTANRIKSVMDALSHISLNYLVNDSLRDILTEKCLFKYNEVFRFLLQIKWGLCTLENLRFPREQKQRPPYIPLNKKDLNFKRLAMVRNWMLYSMQCINSHLMTQLVQTMGEQIEERLKKATNLNDLIALHTSFIYTIHEQCYQKGDDSIRIGIEQLLKLISVLRNEWLNFGNDSDDIDSSAGSVNDATEQIDGIESTYIKCHCYIANELSSQVYTKNKTNLASLSVAFNTSCPY